METKRYRVMKAYYSAHGRRYPVVGMYATEEEALTVLAAGMGSANEAFVDYMTDTSWERIAKRVNGSKEIIRAR